MKIVLFANTDWYLYNFRLALAQRLRDLGHEVLLVSPPGEYAARLVKMGWRWRALAMDRRSLNPLAEARVIYRLTRLLREERPDLVHGFTIKAAVYGSLAARLAGVRGRVNAVAGAGYVFTSDDLRARMLRPFVRQLLKLALDGEGARLILQNPEDMALFEAARLVRADRAHLIPGSGVNCSRFAPGRGAPGPGEPLTVVLAARLLWDKGVQEYVTAADLLRAEGRNVRFLLAGVPDPGNPSSIPEETVRSWAAEGRVEWLGQVEDMAALFASVDVVALPTWYGEGVPRSLIEAAASTRAIVTTDHPGCRDVVTDGVDGLLIPLRDAEALARAIARLQDDPALARRLGEAARRKAVEQFDEQIVIERTVAVYQNLLGAP